MAKLYFVRHGEPAALWGAHPDPGLSELGQAQARAVAEKLLPLNVTSLITSPLARCRETAAPLEGAIGSAAVINHAVAEIPVPIHITEHRPWLMRVMAGRWSDSHVDPMLLAWRASIEQTLLSLRADAIVFSHFVAINAAVGLASGNDLVTQFKPGHASVTMLDNTGGALGLVELGEESAINLA